MDLGTRKFPKSSLESRYRTTAAGGTALAAGLTDKLRLYVGEPDVIRPAVAATRGRM
jgi:hypothetical protein